MGPIRAGVRLADWSRGRTRATGVGLAMMLELEH